MRPVHPGQARELAVDTLAEHMKAREYTYKSKYATGELRDAEYRARARTLLAVLEGAGFRLTYHPDPIPLVPASGYDEDGHDSQA